MKTPLLNQGERFTLKLNREGKIYTPTKIAFYELHVAWRKFVRPLKKLFYKNLQSLLWLWLILFLIVLMITLNSCTTTQRFPKSVVIGKRSGFFIGFWLKAKTLEDYPSKRVFKGDTVWIQTSRRDYFNHMRGDTIR